MGKAENPILFSPHAGSPSVFRHSEHRAELMRSCADFWVDVVTEVARNRKRKASNSGLLVS